MTSQMQTQNALGQLMQMVGNMPQPAPSTMNNIQQVHPMVRKPVHPPTDLKTHFNLHLQQQAAAQQQKQQNAFKPMKPLERKATAIKPQKIGINGINGIPAMNQMTNPALNPMLTNLNAMQNPQLMDPRLFFPAALMTQNVAPKLNGTAPTALQMQQMQQMFAPSLPTTCAPLQYPQLTNEQILTAMSMNAWPMDPSSIMQQPALLNKLYTDHIASFQQQQYIQQAQMAMLQALQNNAVKQLNESPKITPPSSNPPMPQITPSTVSINSNIDPLASLHNMVHRQPKTNSAPVLIASKTPTPVIKKEEPKVEKAEEPVKNEEDEIIDVGTPPEQPQIVQQPQQSQETALRITPPSSAPPKMNGPSFSIAEILHSSSQGQLEELQQRALTPLSIPMPISQNDTATSSRSSTDTLMESQSLPESHSSRHSPSFPKQDSSGQNSKQRMAQRKKHVEFHRRMKAIASRGKFSQCQLCGETVRNNSSDLTNHVYTHSKTPLFGCVKCEAGFRQKVDLHTHCKDKHPNELAEIQDQQIDLRDMAKLCGILENCFPRNSKLVIETLLKKLLKCCKGSDALRCKQCDKDVPSNVTSLKNHLNQHPRYRCKMCHFTNENECEQLKHGQEQHGNESPSYNVTSAAIVLSGTLNSCFGDYMPADQQEFCEEMASMTDPNSPQGSPQLQAPKSN